MQLIVAALEAGEVRPEPHADPARQGGAHVARRLDLDVEAPHRLGVAGGQGHRQPLVELHERIARIAQIRQDETEFVERNQSTELVT